jgi:hypothetical protein
MAGFPVFPGFRERSPGGPPPPVVLWAPRGPATGAHQRGRPIML